MKKFLKIFGIIFLLLILLLVSVPFLFKNTIKEKIMEKVNESVDAQISFTDFSLSVFKNFPNATVEVGGLKVINNAQNRINDAFSGLGEEMGDVGMAIQRAEDKTMQLQARAGAVDELMATGAIDDVTGLGGDDIDRELNQFASSSAVENDLAELKKKIAIENGSQPEQLEAGPSGSSAGNRSQTSGGDH